MWDVFIKLSIYDINLPFAHENVALTTRRLVSIHYTTKLAFPYTSLDTTSPVDLSLRMRLVTPLGSTSSLIR